MAGLPGPGAFDADAQAGGRPVADELPVTVPYSRRVKPGREGDSAVAEAINRHVARHADLFTECLRPALCHNDFHEGNVLVTRDGEGWRVTGYVDVENVVVADPLLALAKTDYFALRHRENKRRAFIRGYGPLPRGWAPRADLYRLHHALEFWNWSASAGKQDVLADIRIDLEEIVSNDAAQ